MFVPYFWPDEIVTRKHILARDGAESYREWLLRIGVLPPADDEPADLPPLRAFVNHGRWIVLCECGNAEYVSPDEPIVLCAVCLNHGAGKWRAVEFPPDPAAIERELVRLPPFLRNWRW